MYVPITSEVTIETGMVLKEIATGLLFEVGVKMKDGTDSWQIKEVAPEELSRIEFVMDRQSLSMKYFAEVD